MKVLQINAIYGSKSTGTIVKDISDKISSVGGTAYVAYQTATKNCENSYKIGNKFDWERHALFSRIFGKQAYYSRRETKKFLKWVKTVQPDIVHLHNLHSNYINLNMLCDYLSENGVTTVITLHDCWFFTGKCTHFINCGCDKWQDKCGKCPQIKKEVPSWFFDKTAKVLKNKTDRLNSIEDLTIVGCSEWITDLASRSLFRPQRFLTIRNGIDTSVFTPRPTKLRKKYGTDNKFAVLGMADKWCQDENKEGVGKIISSQGDDVVFVIVGCDDKKKEIFSAYKNVICLGYINGRDELAEIYSSCDVFVNLTHADTLPTVNMESICSGTPVITFDVGGSPELIDEDDGFVVKEWDFDGIIEKIKDIKENKVEFAVKAKQGKFDKEICFDNYIELYKQILKER